MDTDALRAAGWQPVEPLPCGCTPERLCAPHGWLRDAEQWERYVGALGSRALDTKPVARLARAMTETGPRFGAMNVRRSARKLAAARIRLDLAQQDFNGMVRLAIAHGTSVADVAEAAGLSTARVYQIRDERR